MTEEARQRIDELHRQQRGILLRNYLLIFTSTATILMALVLWAVSARNNQALTVYVQEAQSTVNAACQAAEGRTLPASVQQSCEAAQRNELPQVLESAVNDPDPDDPEYQDQERQEAELQDSETQDPEVQDQETQEPESPDNEIDDPDPDDPEIQEDEVQEGEIQEPEIQDPEQQGAPVCPSGYSQKTFHYFGPDGVDNTGDEQDWLLCVKD
jgi:hypothetical protein